MAQIPRAALDYLTNEVNALSSDAREKVSRLLDSIDWGAADIASARAALVDILIALMPTYTDAAAQAGADFYDALREAAAGEKLGAVAFSGFEPGALDGAVRAFVQDIVDGKPMEQFNRKVLDRIDRDIRRAPNMSVAGNARRDPLKPKYARVPSGDETCSFCLMLASRGAVYSTPEAASHAHPGCDCRVVPSFGDVSEIEGYDPDELYHRWKYGDAGDADRATHSVEKLELPSGRADASLGSAKCDVYTTADGKRFIFPEGIDTSKQDMTPERAIRLYDRIPDNVKSHMQDTVFFVDYPNPEDEYWRKVYKNFTKSYATGGSEITFYAHVGHDDDCVVRTYCHEAGHYIDLCNSTEGRQYSHCGDWQEAMVIDYKNGKRKHPTKYASNADPEDFAESVAEYCINGVQFKKRFPNRSALIDRLLGGGFDG